MTVHNSSQKTAVQRSLAWLTLDPQEQYVVTKWLLNKSFKFLLNE